MHAYAPMQAGRGHQIPWEWSLRWFWAIIWVLGRQPTSSGIGASALSHWATSLALAGILFRFLARPCIVKCFLYLSLMVSESKVLHCLWPKFGIDFCWGWMVWTLFHSYTLGYLIFPASFVWRIFLSPPLFHVCFWRLYSRLGGCRLGGLFLGPLLYSVDVCLLLWLCCEVWDETLLVFSIALSV